MTISILAALESGSEQWDARELADQILTETTARTLYKRVDSIQQAKHRIETEERWENLRFLIVSHGSVMNAYDPESGTMSSVSLLLKELKERYAFKRYELIIIGVSTNDMFGKALMRSGCDVTCASTALKELILELLQPRSGRIKLPEDL